MTHPSYGAESRVPVYSGSRRVPGLYQRLLADGSIVFEARLRLGGKVRRHRLEAKTKTDAIVELRALQTDYARGEHPRSLAVTVADVAADWLTHLGGRIGHRDPRRRYSARTVVLYRQRLRDHILPALGRLPVAEVRVADVRRLVDRLGGLAPSTVTGTLTVLSGLMRFAIRQGVVERNPILDLDRDDRPGTARLTEPRYLNQEEVGRLLAAMTDTFRPSAAACAYAGLRASEALGLRWRDIDFEACTLSVSGQLGAACERVRRRLRR